MSRRTRLTALVAAGLLAALVATGCSSSDDTSAKAVGALDVPERAAPATAATKPCDAAAQAAFDAGAADGGYASLVPPSPMPAPGAMPPGSTMAAIAKHERLVVGVDQNTLQFGYRDPRTGRLEGFDIDLLREVAKAIWPADADHIDDRIQFKAVTTAQRIPAVMRGDVDVLASLLTVTCDRARDVGLSTVYYLAHQRFLVREGSRLEAIGDLAGKRVCATAGSTSLANLERAVPDAVPVPVAARTDCLVALQERRVDAITADDTILRSFQAQDPKTVMLPGSVSNEPYAIAVQGDHEDLLRFVNGRLDQLRASGELDALAVRWIATDGPNGLNPLPLPEPRYR